MNDKMREAVVTLEDGKYTFLLDARGILACHRYGEPWRDFVGDKAIYALFDAYREAIAIKAPSPEAASDIQGALCRAAGWLGALNGESIESTGDLIRSLVKIVKSRPVQEERLSSGFVFVSVEDALPPYEEEVLTTNDTFFAVAERVATTKRGEVWKLCGEDGDDEEARTIVTVKRWCRLPPLSEEGR